MDNNTVSISGTISTPMMFSHESHSERFYSFYISVRRQSGTLDILPVLVSEWLLDCTKDYKGKYIRLKGQFRSFNNKEAKLILSVFATEVEFIEELPEDDNLIYVEGYICKQPTYRKTPLGRSIADLMVAVNRQYKRSDYLPCICWGRSAIATANLEPGTCVSITGRIQSREYQKANESKVAYEVSIIQIIFDM